MKKYLNLVANCRFFWWMGASLRNIYQIYFRSSPLHPISSRNFLFLVLLCCTIWRHCIFYELFFNKLTIRYSKQKLSTFLLVRKLFISIHSAGFSKIILPFNHSFIFHSAYPDVEIPFDWNKMLCMSFLIEEFTNINS